MKNNILIYTVVFVFSFNTASVFSQVGIGTQISQFPLEIATSGEKVIIDSDGKMGVGLTNPKIALDLRAGENGAMGLGMTDQTAGEAGAGAIRYNPNPAIGVKGYVEFSDGTKWIPYHPYGKPRIVVIAEKTNNNVTVFENGYVTIGDYSDGVPARSSTYLTHWIEKLDSDSGTDRNNFDPTKGEFIAPRNGVYFATFTFALEPREVNTTGGNQVEAIWEVRNNSNVVIQRIKTNNGYPSDSGQEALGNSMIVGSSCTVSLYMNEGDKLRPFVWTNVSWDPSGTNEFKYTNSKRRLMNTGGYNVLTIVEQ
ncbi:hypothetical protein HX063_16935 [Myroides odoratimimus]|uniref:hypothetical protein n=1 Tax=Myroides odoratimimus TaxID=76832 RepID=UPI00257610FE|nr:hypothetical protein [Myroides odoratimimus]MDM1497057.1 hypothetical protein [Myroides odoratimimus]